MSANESKTPFKYEFQSEVTISTSGEKGVVVGRAEYQYAERSYLLRYKSADGRAVESWWTESALT